MNEHNKFLEIQKRKLELEKWFEGEKTKNDPGDKYLINWINLNAEEFRNCWNKSKCKYCQKYKDCGYEVKDNCEKFIKEQFFETK